jgi:xanthine dehydrogenase accessory factor
MYDILNDTQKWIINQESVVLATVVSTWGSSPRGVSAKMAFTPEGKITGSVSGGCVEGAVFESGLKTLETRKGELLRFGVADETAFEVGLACGGSIEVLVRPLDPTIFQILQAEIEAHRPVLLVSVVDGPIELVGNEITISVDGKSTGKLGSGLDEQVLSYAKQALASEESKSIFLETENRIPARVFFDVIAPPPTLVMVGGVHIAVALAAIAKALGYITIVVDPRRTFGNSERFPHIDQLIQAWPQEAFKKIKVTRSTAVAMLTHDPKIDDPALKIVLESPAFYIGALGSKKTQRNRRERLLADGLTEDQLDRIHGPIGIDLGAKTPEEIALSIMAEIIAVRRGNS